MFILEKLIPSCQSVAQSLILGEKKKTKKKKKEDVNEVFIRAAIPKSAQWDCEWTWAEPTLPSKTRWVVFSGWCKPRGGWCASQLRSVLSGGCPRGHGGQHFSSLSKHRIKRINSRPHKWIECSFKSKWTRAMILQVFLKSTVTVYPGASLIHLHHRTPSALVWHKGLSALLQEKCVTVPWLISSNTDRSCKTHNKISISYPIEHCFFPSAFLVPSHPSLYL